MAKSTKSGTSGNCPVFGKEPLDAATTAQDGNFEITIDKNKATYTVTYCTNGYFPRADRDIPNHESEEKVIPTPAQLMPLEAVRQANFLNRAIERKVIASLNDLAYLNSIDEKSFLTATANLANAMRPEKRGAIIISLGQLVSDWDR